MSHTTTFGVDGMTCGHCVSAVTSELSALPGVKDVTVELVVGGSSTVSVVVRRAPARRRRSPRPSSRPGYAVTPPEVACCDRPDADRDGPAVATVDLAIEGMTCASCVARVEKRLNRLPGVEATVNLPLESAHVELRLDGTARRRRRRAASPPSARPGTTPRVVERPDAGRAAPTTHHGATAGTRHEAWTRSSTPSPGTRWRPGHDMDPDEDTSAPTDARGTDLRRRLRVAARAHRPRAAAVDDPRAAVHRLAVGRRRARAARRHLGRVAVPPAPRSGPPGTAPRPWTPWCRSASSRRPAGRCGRCCSAARASSA